jgi:hypothetical protein
MPSLLDSALGWMQDPKRTQQLQGVGRSIQQGLLNIEQSDKRYQDLYNQAFADPKNPFKITDKKALSKLTEMTQGGLLGMAEVGMFVGAGSKAFDKAMAFTASKMEKKGATPQEIWKETGTVRGPDGLWRQEISDKEAKFVTAPEMLDKAALLKQGIAENKQKIKESKEYPDLFPKELTKAQKALREENKANKELADTYQYNQAFTGSPANLALEHPELYKAYPDLADVRVMQGTSNPSYLGSFSPKYNALEVTKDGLKKDPRSTALHEMQHAIQEQEGFAVGGNVNQMDRLIGDVRFKAYMLKESDDFKAANKAMQPIWDDYFAGKISKEDVTKLGEEVQKQYPIVQEWRNANSVLEQLGADPVDAYKRLIGEAEARLTQTRRNLSAEDRRKYFPFELGDQQLNPYGLDYPVNTLIHLDEKGNLVQNSLLGQ